MILLNLQDEMKSYVVGSVNLSENKILNETYIFEVIRWQIYGKKFISAWLHLALKLSIRIVKKFYFYFLFDVVYMNLQILLTKMTSTLETYTL